MAISIWVGRAIIICNMKRVHTIFSLTIFLLIIAGNVLACLEIDIDKLKEACRDLSNQLIQYDAELASLNKELPELQKESEKAKQECVRLMADRNDLKSAGGVIERAISALTVELTDWKNLPLPWGVTTSNIIEELTRKINEKTLKLNVFRSEIDELNAQINVLQTKIISLENKKRVVEMQISDLQIHINNDEQSLKEARLNLSNKISRIGIVEQNIKQANTSTQTYSNGINILRSRIAALSAAQQGSGGVISKGVEELQRALQEQRVLLTDALNELESLHFEHGC